MLVEIISGNKFWNKSPYFVSQMHLWVKESGRSRNRRNISQSNSNPARSSVGAEGNKTMAKVCLFYILLWILFFSNFFSYFYIYFLNIFCLFSLVVLFIFYIFNLWLLLNVLNPLYLWLKFNCVILGSTNLGYDISDTVLWIKLATSP